MYSRLASSQRRQNEKKHENPKEFKIIDKLFVVVIIDIQFEQN